MIVTEQMKNNRIRHYSDSGFCILQNETGVVYDDAVDALPCMYTYSETDEQIATAEATEADYVEALRTLGVDVDG